MHTNLDMDVLRTLVAARETGSFQRAAAEIGRSQSAVSQQMRKLEEQLGEPVFRKQGRAVVLTETGEAVLAYARRILALNDEAVGAVRGGRLEGVVRIGAAADLAETALTAALGQFRRAHPGVRVEATVDRNRILLEELDKGRLDVVVALGSAERADAQKLGRLRMAWIGPREFVFEEPLPLAVLQAPCFFRRAATEALDKAGVKHRVVFTSPGLSGVWAAVAGGLGVTLRTAVGLPPSVRVLRAGLPRTPSIDVCLHDAGRTLKPAAARLRELAAEAVASSMYRGT